MPDSTPQNVAARSDILFFLLALQKLLGTFSHVSGFRLRDEADELGPGAPWHPRDRYVRGSYSYY